MKKRFHKKAIPRHVFRDLGKICHPFYAKNDKKENSKILLLKRKLSTMKSNKMQRRSGALRPDNDREESNNNDTNDYNRNIQN